MRRVHLLSCALFALIACKDTSSPGAAGPAQPASGEAAVTPEQPAPKGEPAGTPTGTPELPTGVVVSPRPTPGAEPAKPPAGGAVECTADTRKGGMCTREFRPVCGTYDDNTAKTYANPCVACSDEKVVRYVPGECVAPK